MSRPVDVLAAMLCASVMAPAGDAYVWAVDRPTEPDHTSLVRQLGAASFSEREYTRNAIIRWMHGAGREHDLPGWRLFCEEVGDNRNSRHLYAAMLRSEHELILALSENDSSLQKMLLDRIQFLTSADMSHGRRPISGEALATILFIGIRSQNH